MIAGFRAHGATWAVMGGKLQEEWPQSKHPVDLHNWYKRHKYIVGAEGD